MFNNAFEKTKRTIANEGFAVMAIGSSPTTPSFAYTIGLHIHYNHPELILIGLPIEVAYQVLNTLGHAIKTDNLILPVGGLYNEVFVNMPATFLPVEDSYYADYMGIALRYYNGAMFPLLQCCWPDKNKIFPWQAGFDEEFRPLQPILVEDPALFD